MLQFRHLNCKACLLQVLSEALGWMATAIQEFGLKQLDVKQLIEWLKVDICSTSAPVRTAAIALLGVAHRQLGPGLDPLLSQSVKPALMQTLRETFKANPVEQVRTCQLQNPVIATAVGLAVHSNILLHS